MLTYSQENLYKDLCLYVGVYPEMNGLGREEQGSGERENKAGGKREKDKERERN